MLDLGSEVARVGRFEARRLGLQGPGGGLQASGHLCGCTCRVAKGDGCLGISVATPRHKQSAALFGFSECVACSNEGFEP